MASGTFDYVFPFGPFVAQRAAELARRYGLNKSQFFVAPGNGLRLFLLNTSQPLFRKNPKLRQAVNYAVDRRALAREGGVVAGGVFVEPPTDQYLLPHFPGYQNTRIYPLKGPDLRTARKLAKGHTRGGKAVLYTSTSLGDVARAEILKRNLKAIGLELEVKKFPPGLILEKIATPGEPWDIGRVLYFVPPDPGYLNALFDGRTIGQPESSNFSYFDSPKYNRLLDRASRLTGEERYRAYGELDVQLSQGRRARDSGLGHQLFHVRLSKSRLRRPQRVRESRPDGGLPQVTRAPAAHALRAKRSAPFSGGSPSLCADAPFQRVGATFGCHSMGVDRPLLPCPRRTQAVRRAPVTSRVLGASPDAAVVVVMPQVPGRTRLDRSPTP